VSRKKQQIALRIDIMMNARMYPFRFLVAGFGLFEGKDVVGSESKRLSLSLLTSSSNSDSSPPR